MKKYWFKPKKYGYGFYLISWEGCLATIILLSLVLNAAYINNMFSPEIQLKNGLRCFLDIVILVTLSVIVFNDRTDGSIKWRWGSKK